jgi:hypothetical protein
MNKLPSSVLLALLVTFSGIAVAHAEISKEKRQEVEKMLQLTGMQKLVDQLLAQLITTFKTQIPDVPATFWTKFQEKLDTRELIEKIIPLYDKYYSLEDLKAINAFYSSAAGKKILSTLPQIMQESMKIGREWGEKVGKQAGERELKNK